MVSIPAPSITAPEPLRRRHGLFDAASGPLDMPRYGGAGGVKYMPVTCGETYALGVTCYEAPAVPPTKPADGMEEMVETGVFATLATLTCNAVGFTDPEMQARVRRRLEMNEQAAVERALWTGLDFEGNALDILNLDAEAVEIPYTPAGASDEAFLADVVAGLERWAYTDQGYGSVAYLHAPIEVAAYAAAAGLAIQDGPRRVTPMGSVWSFGAYPAGEIIVSGQVTLWREPEVSVAAAFDNATNTRLLIAERAWAATFDCFAGRAEFDPLGVSS